MGAYVNPKNETKEAFLTREGTPTNLLVNWDEVPQDSLPVILVSNGGFTAAGIAYCEAELRQFQDSLDHRPKKAFLVAKDKLHQVSTELKFYIEEGVSK